MEKIMQQASVDYLEKLIKVQDECVSTDSMKDVPVVYTHVEGFDKDKAIYEIRIFMGLGKYIKDVTIDVAFACEYDNNNKRLFYKAQGNEDPEEAVVRKLSSVLYDDNKDAISYMKI